jgi:hypothetical protein
MEQCISYNLTEADRGPDNRPAGSIGKNLALLRKEQKQGGNGHIPLRLINCGTEIQDVSVMLHVRMQVKQCVYMESVARTQYANTVTLIPTQTHPHKQQHTPYMHSLTCVPEASCGRSACRRVTCCCEAKSCCRSVEPSAVTADSRDSVVASLDTCE